MKKLLSVLIALLPILASYRSIIPNVDLGTFLVIIGILICLIAKSRLAFGKADKFIPIFLYLLLLTPILIVISSSYSNVVLPSNLTAFLRWGKMMVVFLLPMTAAFKERYSEQIAIKTMRIVSYVAVFVVVLQRISYTYGIVINNPLSNLAISDAYFVENYTMMAGNDLFRPSAFFLEPSHFSQYLVFYLVFSLFAVDDNSKVLSKKKNIIKSVIIIVGMLCTGSGMGFALAVAVFVGYILINSKRNLLSSIVLLVLVILAFSLLYKTSFVQSVLERIFTSGTSYGGNAVEARIGNGYKIFAEMPLFNKCIGLGYGNIPTNVYLNGLTYCLISLGIVGTSLFVLCLCRMFNGNVLWKKIAIVVYFTMLVFAQLFTPGSLLFVIVLLRKNTRLDNRTV